MAGAAKTILETRDLQRHYRMGSTLVRALDGVSLSVERSEFLGLLGTSGSGKSTLLNLIAGLDRPTGGELEVLGRSLPAMTSRQLSLHRRATIGIIFQSFNLVSTMTALQNVLLPMIFAAIPRPQRERRAVELLDAVGLSGRHEHRPAELSGGEQQRVAIARALANDPEILLADEPTGNLDSHTAREILGVIKRLNTEEGRTIVLVTHDRSLAFEYVGRTITLLDGKIVAEERK
jgi:putative ABC transport system ATP-binding protein